MFKNTASQKIALFAMDSAGVAKTGDAANITAYVSKDYGATASLTDTSATEISSTNAPGWYWFDVSQSECNADDLLFTGKSSTSGVAIVGRPVRTLPAGFTSQVAQTGDSFARIGAPAGASISADVAATYSRVGAPAGASISADVAAAYSRIGAPVGASISADVAAIKAVLPAAMVGGKIDASVGAVASGVDLSATMKASVATAVLTTQVTESYRADGAAPTLAQALCETLGHLGESSIASTTKTVKKFDGSTTAATFTLNDATTPTSITRAT